MKKSKKNTSTALIVATPPIHAQTLLAKKMAGSPAEIAGIVVGLHHEIGLSWGRGLWLSAFCGKALVELKKTLGHGEWLPYIEKNFAGRGLSERTVRNYLTIWEEARSRLPKSGKLAELPDKPLSEFTSVDQQALIAGLQKICKGETVRTLVGDCLEDSGLAKKSHGHALRTQGGGKRKRGEGDSAADEAEAEKVGAEGAWNQIERDVRREHAEQTWAHLPHAKRKELKQLFSDLASTFAQTLKT